MTARPQRPPPSVHAPRRGPSFPGVPMTSLRALEQDLRQRLHEIQIRLHQLHPRASADIAADVRRNDLCDSAQASGALEAQRMSVERLTLAAQRSTERLQRLAALQKTDPKYRSFLVPIGQWKKVGESGDRDIKAYVELPYMSVDGRVLMAIDEHMAQGKKIVIQAAEFKDDPVSGQKLCQVTVKADLRGEATGTARLFIGGGGANRENPVENAETSAIGRALGFLGYGCFGTGIASAEEMIAAPGRDPSHGQVTRDADDGNVSAGARPGTPTSGPAPERASALEPPRSPEGGVLGRAQANTPP